MKLEWLKIIRVSKSTNPQLYGSVLCKCYSPLNGVVMHNFDITQRVYSILHDILIIDDEFEEDYYMLCFVGEGFVLNPIWIGKVLTDKLQDVVIDNIISRISNFKSLTNIKIGDSILYFGDVK